MKATILALIVGMASVGTLIAVCGCETKSASQAEIIVTPASADLAKGNSITLTASGWDDYRWSLSDETIGTLTPRTGDTVKYTNISSNGSNRVQIITAKGLVTGETSNSNTLPFVISGQAIVHHI